MTKTIDLFGQAVLLKNEIEDLKISLTVERSKKESDKTRKEHSVQGLLYQKGEELKKLKVSFSKMMQEKFYEMDPEKFGFLKFKSLGIWGKNIGEELFFVVANIFFESHLSKSRSTFVHFNVLNEEFKGDCFVNAKSAVMEIANIFSKKYLGEKNRLIISLEIAHYGHGSFKFNFEWD